MDEGAHIAGYALADLCRRAAQSSGVPVIFFTSIGKAGGLVVGLAGFEPATSDPQGIRPSYTHVSDCLFPYTETLAAAGVRGGFVLDE